MFVCVVLQIRLGNVCLSCSNCAYLIIALNSKTNLNLESYTLNAHTSHTAQVQFFLHRKPTFGSFNVKVLSISEIKKKIVIKWTLATSSVTGHWKHSAAHIQCLIFGVTCACSFIENRMLSKTATWWLRVCVVTTVFFVRMWSGCRFGESFISLEKETMVFCSKMWPLWLIGGLLRVDWSMSIWSLVLRKRFHCGRPCGLIAGGRGGDDCFLFAGDFGASMPFDADCFSKMDRFSWIEFCFVRIGNFFGCAKLLAFVDGTE